MWGRGFSPSLTPLALSVTPVTPLTRPERLLTTPNRPNRRLKIQRCILQPARVAAALRHVSSRIETCDLFETRAAPGHHVVERVLALWRNQRLSSDKNQDDAQRGDAAAERKEWHRGSCWQRPLGSVGSQTDTYSFAIRASALGRFFLIGITVVSTNNSGVKSRLKSLKQRRYFNTVILKKKNSVNSEILDNAIIKE